MHIQLKQLIISNIRNLLDTNIDLGPKFNVFVGANGSGKTSLLEAIHLLSLGRSFRARSMQQIIAFGADQCLIRARVHTQASSHGDAGVWLGVVRGVNGDSQFKIGEHAEKSASELTKQLPVQLLDVNSTLLIEGGPIYRRQFLDWGVFHVEHTFIDSWRLMRRALEQRNAVLKRRQLPPAEWDEAFIKYAQLVDAARAAYFVLYKEICCAMLQELLGVELGLGYLRGWSDDRDLADALATTAKMDLAFGYTNRGPQRADLEILVDGRPAKTVLSRGRLKIVVSIMYLARAKLLGMLELQPNELSSPVASSVLLVDDLQAELDKHSCDLFISAINKLNCQAFITGVEAELLTARLNDCETRMFHVEQGRIVVA